MGDRRAAVAAWLEANSPAPKVHEAFGAEWEIPAQMPAALWFWSQATFREQDRNIFTECRYSDLDEAIGILQLEPLIKEWAACGLSMEQVYDEVHGITLRYLFPGLFVEDGDASGEAEAPAKVKTSGRSSPSTSASSRRTSGGSTGSSSRKRSKKA